MSIKTEENSTLQSAVDKLIETNFCGLNNESSKLDLLLPVIIYHGMLTGKDIKGTRFFSMCVLNTSNVMITVDGEDIELFQKGDVVLPNKAYSKIAWSASAMTPGGTFQRDECKFQAKKIKEGILNVCDFFNVNCEVDCNGSIMNPDRNKFEIVITIN